MITWALVALVKVLSQVENLGEVKLGGHLSLAMIADVAIVWIIMANIAKC